MNRILALLLMLALIPLACADPTADSLSVSSASGDSGDTNVMVLVNITNVIDGPIMVMGFDIIYDPTVVALVGAGRGSDLPTDEFGDPVWDVSLGADKKTIGLTTLQYQDYALSNGTTGNMVKLYFNVNATATSGDHPIEISNVDISSTCLVHGTIPVINGTFTITGGTPGDLNGDGAITSADAVIVLQMAVRGEYDALADVNGDDSVTSLDALMIIQVAADRITI